MRKDSSPMYVDQCNCFAVRKAARQITRFYDERLVSTGLKITQFSILSCLNSLGGAAVNELSEKLDVERTAMGKMITTLERDGIVKVSPSPTDARSRIAELTPAGRRLFDRAAPLWQDAQRQFSEINGADRLADIHRTLGELRGLE